MSMNFIEPDVQQKKVPVFVVLENFTVSSKNKGLPSLPRDIELPPDFEDDLSSFIKGINEEDLKDIQLLFLFDFCVLNPYFFDDNELLSERIKIIPALFTQKEDSKPSVFKPSVANILDNIKNCADNDKKFDEAYQKKLHEIRADSSFEERAVYYVKLVFQNLPKHTYKEDEKRPTQEEINSFLDFWENDFLNMPYSLRLIAELEEMSEDKLYVKYLFPGKIIFKYDISAFPLIVYGKELYSYINSILYLLKYTLLGQKISNDDIVQIKIPQWDEKNYIHEIYFSLAQIQNDKDTSMLIFNKILEGVNPVDIPYIFFKYIEDHASSIYGQLLKSVDSDVIEPIRDELEYLDWALTTDTNDPHKIYFDKARLFLDYIKNLSNSAPEDKLEFFQELFFKRASYTTFQDKFWSLRQKTIKEILTSIAREKKQGEWTFPERQGEANALYDEFVDVIAKGAAKYPVKSFLAGEWQNLSMQKQNDHGLIVFRRYCEKLELKNYEDSIFVSKFWFNLFYLEQPFFLSEFITSYRYSSKLEEEGPFFYKNVFSKFIENEDFICRFLSIPKKYSCSPLAMYCLACWVLYQYKDENMSDVFDEASEKLLSRKKITFPDKIAEFIRSYKIPDKLFKNGDNNEARRFLFYLNSALGGEQYDSILKDLHSTEEHFPLYYIRYNYSHHEIVHEEFLDFLFSKKNPSRWGNKDVFYNLELIQEACKKDKLKKQIVLEKVSDYIDKNRELLVKSSKIEKFIKYFFIETEESGHSEAQTVFFTQFCERAIQENEASCTELYLFFRIYHDFHNKAETILEKHTDINNLLVTRCCKMLNNFRKNIEQKEFSENQDEYLNDYILPASYFVSERTGNIWKSLKPLILAFRASKNVLLDESLKPTNNFSYSLLNEITYSFMIEDQEKLKELRYDMANDFAEYLKPAKKERQAEKYTQKERETEGFDLSYTEPSPYWRYAYIRALGDLGIKIDKRGHYFHKILENVIEKDPSEDVKTAANKVIKGLDSIRKGYSGVNHKKCLFEAFWWLKNAHMLSLDGKVDSKKALELRIKEWR